MAREIEKEKRAKDRTAHRLSLPQRRYSRREYGGPTTAAAKHTTGECQRAIVTTSLHDVWGATGAPFSQRQCLHAVVVERSAA